MGIVRNLVTMGTPWQGTKMHIFAIGRQSHALALDAPEIRESIRRIGGSRRLGESEEARVLLETYHEAKPAFRDPWTESLEEHQRGMATINRRARAWIAPRKGWARGFEYMGRRMQRLPDAPESIALGLCGTKLP